ncbi:MAG: hypothetical protein ACO3SE_09555, partial [Sedimenticolaceae bacterium]
HGVGGDHHGSEDGQDAGGSRRAERLGVHDLAGEKQDTGEQGELGLIGQIIEHRAKARHLVFGDILF